MKIKFWGVRGSIPTSGADTNKYGGNTSCLTLTGADYNLVLDGGSGMQNVSFADPMIDNRIDILLTHYHLDHLQGLGFFKSLFNPNLEIHIWGPAADYDELHFRLNRYLSPPLFPVLLRDLPCKLHLHAINNSHFSIGALDIHARYVIHPGPTVGYRIKEGNKVFTYIPDHEPALGPEGMLKSSNWISGFDLADQADLLYHDGQYTAHEYLTRIGWGHSSMADAVLFARASQAKHLILAHHDPGHTDEQLDEIYAHLMDDHLCEFVCELAREGITIEL